MMTSDLDINEQNLKVFSALSGLTGYQIRAYIAVATGSHRPVEIAHKAQIPISKIYENLYTLERKGWIVNVSSDDHKTYVHDRNKLKDFMNDVEHIATRYLDFIDYLIAGWMFHNRHKDPEAFREYREKLNNSWMVKTTPLDNSAEQEDGIRP